jgi:ribosomal protein L32
VCRIANPTQRAGAYEVLVEDQVTGRYMNKHRWTTYCGYHHDQTEWNFIAQGVMPPYEIASDEACDNGRSKLHKTQKEEDLKSERAITARGCFPA